MQKQTFHHAIILFILDCCMKSSDMTPAIVDMTPAIADMTPAIVDMTPVIADMTPAIADLPQKILSESLSSPVECYHVTIR